MRLEAVGLGAGTKSEVAAWLGFSRNAVGPFLDEMGINPVCGKYPWIRLVETVLGVVPEPQDVPDLMLPLMPLAEAASELGITAETLKGRIETGELSTPPLYVFGPRRRRFLRRQFQEFVRSPRGDFKHHEWIGSGFLTLAEIATQADLSPDDFTVKVRDGDLAEPCHVILTGGRKRYFSQAPKASDKSSSRPFEHVHQPHSTSTSGGVFGAASRAIRLESAT
jgi:hypothetical protein